MKTLLLFGCLVCFLGLILVQPVVAENSSKETSWGMIKALYGDGEIFLSSPTSANSINALGRVAYQQLLKREGGKISQSKEAPGMCIALYVPYYSQCDPSWRWDKLGYSTTSTIDRYGCHLTCISMLYALWGNNYLNPRNLNNWAKSVGAFNDDFIVADRAIVYGCYRRVRYIQPAQILSELYSGHPVIVNTDQYGSHFVIIFGFDGYRFWVKDPYQPDWRYQNQPLTGNLYNGNRDGRAVRVYGY